MASGSASMSTEVMVVMTSGVAGVPSGEALVPIFPPLLLQKLRPAVARKMGLSRPLSGH